MATLHVDIETYSTIDIGKAGLYRYVEDPDFEVLLIAYAYDDDPVQIGTPAECPPQLFTDLQDPEVKKVAHNATFERECLGKMIGAELPPEQWDDTMIMALRHGLPASLDAVGAALRLTEQKIKEGAQLIQYFCKPCRATKSNGGRT